MLTAEQRHEFRQTGILRLSGAFTRDEAAAMRATVWRHIERKTDVRRSDPATWTSRPVVSFKSLRRNRVFAPLVERAPVRAALDGLFDAGGWRPPRPGAQVLVTLPSPPPWSLPHRLWHMDCGFDRPTWPPFAVKMFACVSCVAPEGGATLAIAGSHRLVERFAHTLAPDERAGHRTRWDRFMRQDEWLNELIRPGEEPDRTRRLFGIRHEVAGIPVEVVELAGEPGDVFVTHLHVFHCASRNVNDEVRVMLGKEIKAVAG